MEFRYLEAFRAIAKEKHFGRAAQRLFLAQSSVARLDGPLLAVGELEQVVGGVVVEFAEAGQG
ncbi:LysR family transcriptional regulator [Micromonospora sp. CPCC 206060]|uniref:LysR family transcriptional regulator n=1 Tax=Micromonospora sp. CPCC 206060 TaxID=3122406 RepID=UPI002FF34269